MIFLPLTIFFLAYLWARHHGTAQARRWEQAASTAHQAAVAAQSADAQRDAAVERRLDQPGWTGLDDHQLNRLLDQSAS